MRTFALSLGFFVVALVLTALLYSLVSVPATQALSTEHARVGHEVPADGRLHWATVEASQEEEDG